MFLLLSIALLLRQVTLLLLAILIPLAAVFIDLFPECDKQSADGDRYCQ